MPMLVYTTVFSLNKSYLGRRDYCQDRENPKWWMAMGSSSRGRRATKQFTSPSDTQPLVLCLPYIQHLGIPSSFLQVRTLTLEGACPCRVTHLGLWTQAFDPNCSVLSYSDVAVTSLIHHSAPPWTCWISVSAESHMSLDYHQDDKVHICQRVFLMPHKPTQCMCKHSADFSGPPEPEVTRRVG